MGISNSLELKINKELKPTLTQICNNKENSSGSEMDHVDSAGSDTNNDEKKYYKHKGIHLNCVKVPKT